MSLWKPVAVVFALIWTLYNGAVGVRIVADQVNLFAGVSYIGAIERQPMSSHYE